MIRDPDERELGRRIRSVRESKGLSLRAVAQAAGISESFLSQVERGVASPSVASLRRIAESLGESVGSLFEGPASGGKVVRVADRRRLVHPRRHWEDVLLTPSDSKRLQVILSMIEPGAGSGKQPYAHDSDEECVIVLKGRLEFWVEEERFDLDEGDSLVFESRRPHRNRNPGPTKAEVLWVITPPSY
ncbi:MAG TPA: cupin domain-containing protein [Actinomycetota bacterium]|nr:cupin domain-containing protein [Actinomycetota bacterium]